MLGILSNNRIVNDTIKNSVMKARNASLNPVPVLEYYGMIRDMGLRACYIAGAVLNIDIVQVPKFRRK